MMLSQRKAGAKYCSGCGNELDPYEAIKWTVCIKELEERLKGRM